MKHLLLLICIAASCISFTSLSPAKDVVYVCVSKTSVAYHGTRGCSGLSRCTHEIKAMTRQEAKDLGKRDCHICQPG